MVRACEGAADVSVAAEGAPGGCWFEPSSVWCSGVSSLIHFWVFWQQQTSVVIEALPFHTAEWTRSVSRASYRSEEEKKHLCLQTGVDGVDSESRKCENRWGGSCWEESWGAAKCCFFTQKVINSDFNINHSLARLRKRHSAPFSSSPGCCSYDLGDSGGSRDR